MGPGSSCDAVDFRSRLLDLSAQFCANVEIKDRKYRLRTYRQCFLGSEAVDFLLESGFAKSRRGAVHLGRFLASEYQLFDHVCGDHELKDKFLFYRFDNMEEKKSEDGKYPFLKPTINTSKDRLMQTNGDTAEDQTRQLRPRISASSPISLDFDSIGACGREGELKLMEGLVLKKLSRNLQAVTNNGENLAPTTSAILLEGESGSGKCALVGQVWKNVRAATEKYNKTSILVGNGKFEQQFEQQPELSMPFYALTQAVSEIVDQLFLTIYQKDSDGTSGTSTGERLKWKAKLREAMGLSDESAKVFSSLVPRLGDLLMTNHRYDGYIGYTSSDDDGDDSSDEGYSDIGMQQQIGFEGLKEVFRDLFRALSSEFSIVLRLDDMQFADEKSILLLEFLLGDDTLQEQPFLFVGTHHPVKEDSTSEFARARETLQAERIELGNLSVAGVNEILHQLLKLGREETQQLAATIHGKTQGSPFFVTQFLSMMEQKGLLAFSVENLKWEYDLDEIANKMDLADNVADVLVEKLRCLPEAQRDIVVLASTLGSTEVETDVMEALLLAYMEFKQREQGNDHDLSTMAPEWTPQLVRDIGQLVKGGFVVRTKSPDHYRFAHDKVRQAGLSFLPTSPEDRRRLYLTLGKQLQTMVESLNSAELQISMLLFQAVGLLNQAQDLVSDPNERKTLAKLNYKAAIMATARSSFFPASDFLETAVGLLSTLPYGGWGVTYNLMLLIADLRITVEFRCGRLDKSNEIADEVLGKTKSFEERKHAYFGKMLALMQSGEGVEARRLAISVLALLGVTFPRTITSGDVAGAKDLVMHLLQSKSDQDLMELPQLTDPNALTIMQFLERLTELSFTAGNPDPMTGMLCLAWSMETTLRYGNSKMSCISFVHFGMLCMMLGMPKEGHRFGELALRYTKKNPGVPRYDCRCQVLYGFWIGHWRYPYQNFVATLGSVLKECWQKGVLENYFIDAHAYFDSYLCAGLSLGPLRIDIERIAGQMRDNQRLQALRNDAPLFQLVSNLVGQEDMDESQLLADLDFCGQYYVPELEEEWLVDGNSQPLQKLYLFQMIHCYLFNMYKEAHGFLLKLWPDESLYSAAFLIYQTFYRGMVHFAIAQRQKHNQGKRQKLVKAGKDVIKKMIAWVEGGNINAHHLLLLLQAEELTTGKASHSEVRVAFDKAISAAARLGFMHSKAIGNERAGLFFLKEGDSEWAATYLQSASNSYEDWGAMGKVDQIQLKHRRLLRKNTGRVSISIPELVSARTESVNTRGRLGVCRLDELSTDSHHSLRSAMSSRSIESDRDSFGNMSLSFCDSRYSSDGSMPVEPNDGEA